MCEMFEHLPHHGYGQESPYQIALSMVPTCRLLLKHVKLSMIFWLPTARYNHGLSPHSVEFDVHGATNYLAISLR
jgi:hypothetical protein